MLAHYLRGRIPLKSLGARVPAVDHAGRVEHVDRVVGDGFDEEAVSPFLGDMRAQLNGIFHSGVRLGGTPDYLQRVSI
jgi:hypothetical protein